MGDLINLKRLKKRVARAQSAKQAKVNRARFGQTQSQRELEKRRADRADKLLDQHRIDGGDDSL